MSPFSFLVFQIFGVFPFNFSSHQKKILPSKFWRYWSVFANLFVMLACCTQIMMLWSEKSLHDGQFIYVTLFRYQPVIILIEVILLSSVVMSKSFFRTLEIYVQAIVKITTSETDKLTKKAIVVVLLLICVFYLFVLHYLHFKRMDSWSVLLRIGLTFTLTSYCSIHHLHFYIALYIINFKLMEKAKKLEDLRSRPRYLKVHIRNKHVEKIDEILRSFNCFSKIYHFFAKVMTFRVFYDALLGIKYMEDVELILKEGDSLEIFYEILGVIYHLYGVPMLFMIINQGHIFKTEVKFFNFCYYLPASLFNIFSYKIF